ncbi:MAG: DUF2891 domain-containing protein [Deltaproteobacteria bacterium]|nr:DUF2891 domain-containing protein [Deltaproteobacteria bacterium]
MFPLVAAIVTVAWLSACQKPETPSGKTPLQALPGGNASSSGQPPATIQDIEANVPDLACPALDEPLAAKFAALSLACADREFPNKPGNVVDGDETVRPPRELTPAFFGCFDWHSAVHGHWAMARVLRLFPNMPAAASIRSKLNAHLSPGRMEEELAYLRAERNRTFERPYGWGWFLRLAAEIHGFDDDDARRWHAAVKPVAEHLSARTIAYLNVLSVPIRDGTHQNTAFSLVHMLDYAREVKDSALEAAILRRARDFYLKDRSCPTDYEPSGEDFVSACFAEADLMRRVLPAAEFRAWYERFMPPMNGMRFAPLLGPVEVKDMKDPRIGHLIGLSFHRAWAMRGVAHRMSNVELQMPNGEPRQPIRHSTLDTRHLLEKLARRHCHGALRQMFDSGYGGEHWLATFAVYLLSEAGSG